MTTDKATKRAVRTRMTKTGERYAAARRHVVGDAATDDVAAPTLPPRVAEPGMSEATILRGSGRSWDDWLRLLDDWGARERTHTDIARHVNRDYGVAGWWAQTVTVGYEWARGMRVRHEAPGGFGVSVTRTVGASADDVWRDFTEPRRRDTWLARGTLRLRPNTGTRGKSARFDGADGRLIHIYLTAKGERCSVAVTCEGLAGPDEVESQRTIWRERLDRLVERWTSAAVAQPRRRAS